MDASPSAPSAATSPSAAGFSGSLTIVGAATVAITKSLSEIVGFTFSGRLTDDIFTLVPIVVEDGLGYTPLVVSCILLVHQSFGLWLPAIAGMIYDRYNPRWLGPVSLMLVAIGVGLLGIFASVVPVWGIPILLVPASIGTGLFISPYNALVMNTLPENRGFASGMLETTRQMGHTIGTTMAAMILGLSLPATIGLIPDIDAQIYYQEGFRLAALTVVWIVSAGCIVALFQKVPVVASATAPPEGSAPSSAD